MFENPVSLRVRSLRKRSFYGLGVAALALPLLLVPSVAQAGTFAPADGLAAIENDDYVAGYQEEFISQVNPDTIWGHDYELSVEIGPRVAGSPGEDAAVEYVQHLFEDFGFDSELETFDTRSQNYANVTPSRYQEGYASWQFRPINGTFTGADAPVSGDLIDVGSKDDLSSFDLTGKVALANWIQNPTERNERLAALEAAGADAIVLAQTSGSEALPNLGWGETPVVRDTVVVTAATNQGKRMRDLLDEGPLTLSITTEQSRDTSTNVIGTRPAANGDQNAPIVYIGAHIDSVVGSPGASDNGSGASIMLDLARIIGQYSLDTEIRVGAWGAEEIGILGSKHHVDTLTQAEIDRTIGAWNMDMAGTSYEGTPGQPFKFWALTVDGAEVDENSVLQYGNLVSNEIGHGDLPIGQVGRSDHQYFHDAGIDAAVFSWMHWAGGTNIVLEPAYHMTTDTLEFVSAERMGFAAEVLGGSAFRAALNEITVDVVDENGAVAADVPVAMSCGDDEGWREVGVTDSAGTATTVAPHVTCDFAALAENGAEGSALSTPISGDTAVHVELMVDTEAPVVTISVDPSANENGWHQSAPVAVTIAAVDDVDVDPEVEFSTDGVAWLSYTDVLALEDDGEHTVYARATDGSGNTGEAEAVVLIDTQAPTVSVTKDPSERGQVMVEANDSLSGVERVEYRLLPDGEWRVFEGEDLGSDGILVGQLALGDDAIRAEFRAIDVAGNVSEPTSVGFDQVAKESDGALPTTGIDTNVLWAFGTTAILLASGTTLLIVRRIRGKIVVA